MTFDARGPGAPGKSTKTNALFGAATFAVAATVFLAIVNLPHPDKAPALAPVSSASGQIFPSPAATDYFERLARIDAAARADLDMRLGGAGMASAREQTQIVLDHASLVLKAHARDLAQAETSHLDAMLELTRSRLRKASRKGSRWCKGSTYAGLDPSDLASVDLFERDLAGLEMPVRDYAFEMLGGLMAAIEDARVHPAAHGPMTPSDEAAIQGAFYSVMSDPQVLPVLMAAQSGGDQARAMAAVDVCDLANTAVLALKTLPQDTKGRMFARMVSEMEAGGGKSALASLPGY